MGLVGPVSVYCVWMRWRVGSAASVSVWQRVKLSRSVPEIHSHVAGTFSNQQTTIVHRHLTKPTTLHIFCIQSRTFRVAVDTGRVSSVPTSTGPWQSVLDFSTAVTLCSCPPYLYTGTSLNRQLCIFSVFNLGHSVWPYTRAV